MKVRLLLLVGLAALFLGGVRATNASPQIACLFQAGQCVWHGCIGGCVLKGDTCQCILMDKKSN